MKHKKAPRVFVTGFLGSDRHSAAEKLAADLGYSIVDLDHEIEKKGWQICAKNLYDDGGT